MKVGVVGAGIVGLAVAREVLVARPDAQVVVYEKEPVVGRHQTGHNTGVIHSGILNGAGTEKFAACLEGAALMGDFCVRAGVPTAVRGKLVVAVTGEELVRLRRRYDDAVGAGLASARWLGPSEIVDVEPHVRGLGAIHTPETAVVDFRKVAEAIATDVEARGGEVRLATPVTGLDSVGARTRVETAAEATTYDLVVACAGLQADRVAELSGQPADPRVVPFKGVYLHLRPERDHLVRGLVYPVADPRYPFLGVHLARHVDGSVSLGPSAVLALGREAYDRDGRDLREFLRTVTGPGFGRLTARNLRAGLDGVAMSGSRRWFVGKARRYLPELSAADFAGASAGIRAQAVDRHGRLVDDFRIVRTGSVVNVRNARSPAATAAFAVARTVTRYLPELDVGRRAWQPR